MTFKHDCQADIRENPCRHSRERSFEKDVGVGENEEKGKLEFRCDFSLVKNLRSMKNAKRFNEGRVAIFDLFCVSLKEKCLSAPLRGTA